MFIYNPNTLFVEQFLALEPTINTDIIYNLDE